MNLYDQIVCLIRILVLWRLMLLLFQVLLCLFRGLTYQVAMMVGMHAMHQLSNMDFPRTKGELATSMAKCSSCYNSNYFWSTLCYLSKAYHDLSLVARIHWVCFSCSVSPNMIIHELTDCFPIRLCI